MTNPHQSDEGGEHHAHSHHHTLLSAAGRPHLQVVLEGCEEVGHQGLLRQDGLHWGEREGESGGEDGAHKITGVGTLTNKKYTKL